MKRNLSNVIFFVKQTQRTRQEKNNKKTRKEKINKIARKKQKKTKQDRERQRVKKEKWKNKEKERKTLKNEQNNPFSGEKQCFCKRQKTQNTKKGWRPTAPKHSAGFSLLSLWSPHGHVSSSYALFIAKVSLILFFFTFGVLCFFFLAVVFRFLFPCLSLLCVLQARFYCLFFCIFCVTKKTDQITEYLKCSFWCSVLVPASSHFHLAQPRTPTRTREPLLKMVFDSFWWFLTLCWNTYFYSVSWTSIRISPIKMGPKENDNLSQRVKPKLVF